MEEAVTILSLPDELLTIILQYINSSDVIHFGLTCTKFNVLVTNNRYLWKQKLKEILPNDQIKLIEIQNVSNWMDVYKNFFLVKRSVYYELTKLITSHYSRVEDLTLQDVKEFFDIVLSDSSSYQYVIYLLQDLITKAHKSAEGHHCEPPFTLSEAYYAKDVLSYLIQMFLIVKWVQAHLTNELHPEVVLNFFIQWMDPLHLHTDEEVEAVIANVLEKVEKMLMPKPETLLHFEGMPQQVENILTSDQYMSVQMNVADRLAKGLLREKQVMAAISDVIYHQMRLVVVDSANLDTLDILKVVKNKCGDGIVIAALYLAVAKRCGVPCELVAFPNHLILQWRHLQDFTSRVHYFKLDLRSGAWVPKGRCPFATDFNNSYKYCPDSLLQYIISLYLGSKGYVKDWFHKNSSLLLDFLSTDHGSTSPYRNLLPFLRSYGHMPAFNHAVKLTSMRTSHLRIIGSLVGLNSCREPVYKHMVVWKRDTKVKYAVGMICTHTKYDYVCVVVGWEPRSERDGHTSTLRHGAQQPFYHVVALDLSNRYVAQENIANVDQPYRLYHMEEVISKYFTHFDGFSYVPNSATRREYPEDDPIREVYRAKAKLMAVAGGND